MRFFNMLKIKVVEYLVSHPIHLYLIFEKIKFDELERQKKCVYNLFRRFHDSKKELDGQWHFQSLPSIQFNGLTHNF